LGNYYLIEINYNYGGSEMYKTPTQVKQEKKISIATIIAYNTLKANAYLWTSDMDKATESLITHLYYDLVYACYQDFIGLSTFPMNANFDVKIHTYDHFLRPQTVCKYIMDNKNVYLEDFIKFAEVFNSCRQVIRCTKKENKALSIQTKEGGGYTQDQYKNAGIRLYDNNGILDENTVLPVIEGLVEWEGRYNDNDSRSTLVEIPKPITLDTFMA
jgi:hypothetical protein